MLQGRQKPEKTKATTATSTTTDTRKDSAAVSGPEPKRRSRIGKISTTEKRTATAAKVVKITKTFNNEFKETAIDTRQGDNLAATMLEIPATRQNNDDHDHGNPQQGAETIDRRGSNLDDGLPEFLAVTIARTERANNARRRDQRSESKSNTRTTQQITSKGGVSTDRLQQSRMKISKAKTKHEDHEKTKTNRSP